jgi:hypothetical protein
MLFHVIMLPDLRDKLAGYGRTDVLRSYTYLHDGKIVINLTKLARGAAFVAPALFGIGNL